MDKIRRNDRMSAMIKILTDSPNEVIRLSYFCDLFGAAKSTMSEDVDLLRDVVKTFGLGEIETVTGASGGVRYRPRVRRDNARKFVRELSTVLSTPGRVLPGGFLYCSDILSNPDTVRMMGNILATEFAQCGADFVLTMETKGIPVAYATANALGLPLNIARRSAQVYEGPAVNINYVSGSSGSIQTMSLTRRTVESGTKALIIDDFLKGGGTTKGMIDLMREFDVTVVGTGFVMETITPKKKKITGQKSLMVIDVDEEKETAIARPADWLMD